MHPPRELPAWALSPAKMRVYLTGFNLFSLCGWVTILLRSMLYFVAPGTGENYFRAVEWPLKYFETFAAFEVVHAALGMVPSSLFANFVQGVFSST